MGYYCKNIIIHVEETASAAHFADLHTHQEEEEDGGPTHAGMAQTMADGEVKGEMLIDGV